MSRRCKCASTVHKQKGDEIKEVKDFGLCFHPYLAHMTDLMAGPPNAQGRRIKAVKETRWKGKRR